METRVETGQFQHYSCIEFGRFKLRLRTIRKGDQQNNGKMPYKNKSDLPDQVRNVLPSHGQEIYQAAYNNAWDEYKKPSDRKEDSSREETAHKVAWAAVKQKYKKNKEGDWVEK